MKREDLQKAIETDSALKKVDNSIKTIDNGLKSVEKLTGSHLRVRFEDPNTLFSVDHVFTKSDIDTLLTNKKLSLLQEKEFLEIELDEI